MKLSYPGERPGDAKDQPSQPTLPMQEDAIVRYRLGYLEFGRGMDSQELQILWIGRFFILSETETSAAG
jgi:hypothetical protein